MNKNGADPEFTAVLAWMGLPFVGEKSLAAVLQHGRESRQSLAELWKAPPADLGHLLKLHPRSVAALESAAADRWEQAARDAEQARKLGVDLLVPTAPDCPPALRRAHGAGGRSWPVLFAYGALGLLEEPRVAIISSKDPSPIALQATDALADALARRDISLLTSTSRDAYQAAATAAKRHAGPTVLVMDRSIAEAFSGGVAREPVPAARVWDENFDVDLQLLLSPFGWRERWTARSGPRRDALLLDLADLVVAIDVRPDGIMERECRRRLQGGRPVLALDRGADTPEGTRRLWEEEPAAFRLPWSGAEAAVAEIERRLPGGTPAAQEERLGEAWSREVAQFLARACRALSRREHDAAPQAAPGGGVVLSYPGTGPVAQVAAAWTVREGNRTEGASWLLADLVSESGQSPRRLATLLERVARGGLAAAMVPTPWLEAAAHADTRQEWLRHTGLRAVVRLPLAASGGQPAAVVLLEKAAAHNSPAVFTPEQARMGRFHLRRYLQEVLAALSAAK